MTGAVEWEIPRAERAYLRDLAARQAEYAALPVMEERRQMWLDLNDGRPGARPPVILETWTFDRDFMPPDILQCETPVARGLESGLLRNLRNHELIDDDKVIPDTIDVGWSIEIDEMGVPIERRSADDVDGIATGYAFEHPIKDLAEGLERLRPAVCRVDHDRTASQKAFIEELFDGLLGVRLGSGPMGMTMLTERVIELMGMEAFFMAMFDSPDEVHALMAFLRDNALRVMRWSESEGLLRLNNGDQSSFGSSYNFTTRLPAPGFTGEPARLCDMWGAANSQETVGISPELFREFCFPYYRDVCEPVGLLYYGCCEPVHPFWEDLQHLPHLKKASISRWCDQCAMGEALRGSEIVFSRKPDPNFLGVDVMLNEEGWRAHIRETLEATTDVFVEFIIRDVYTVHGDIAKARRAVELARGEVDRHMARRS